MRRVGRVEGASKTGGLMTITGGRDLTRAEKPGLLQVPITFLARKQEASDLRGEGRGERVPGPLMFSPGGIPVIVGAV